MSHISSHWGAAASSEHVKDEIQSWWVCREGWLVGLSRGFVVGRLEGLSWCMSLFGGFV